MSTGIEGLMQAQRAYYNTGATRPLEFRLEALKRLEAAILQNRSAIEEALLKDLNKSPTEAYITEISMVLEELRFHMKHLAGWLKPRRAKTPLVQFPAKSFVVPEPYGLALVMAPWNYPVQLCLSPLVGAISGGNCAIVKPSAYAPAASRAVAKILGEAFAPQYIAAVEGGRAENSALLEQRFDYIFFTGSAAVGRLVMEAAAKGPTPVTLELGGKSPVIVDKSANIPVAARRIAFGKVLNAGQTCVAPDYLLIHESLEEAFIQAYREALSGFFPGGDMAAMPVIVNQKHFLRLCALLKSGKAAVGGGTDPARRFVEPTLLRGAAADSPIMQEEIFGPILPLIPYKSLEECLDFINARPKPLALYLFTQDRAVEERVFGRCSFGGGCVNDTIMHVASPHMPFGGVGQSGMGSYHGRAGFDTFTHYRSILKKGIWPDIPLRYPPYGEKKARMIRRFLK